MSKNKIKNVIELGWIIVMIISSSIFFFLMLR